MVKLTDWFKSKKTPKKSAPAPKPERAFDRFLELEESTQQDFVKEEKLSRQEQDAILKYRRQADQIGDAYVSDLLNRIILDEQIHVEIFREMIGAATAL